MYTTITTLNQVTGEVAEDKIHLTNGTARVSLGFDHMGAGLGSLWTLLTPEKARHLAEALIKHAEDVENHPYYRPQMP